MTNATKETNMATWRASFHTGYLNWPAFASLTGSSRVRTGYQCSVEAPTREAAIEAATAKALDFDSNATLQQIQQVHSYAVKVKGRHDKRKRETFIIPGTSEADAEQNARSGRYQGGVSANRFGGYGKKLDIVSVEEVAV